MQAIPPSTGLTVVIKQESITEELAPDEHPEQFEFKAKITCTKAGTYTLGWNATIDAAQNSDSTNDTITAETSVRCKSNYHDEDDEENENDDEHEEENNDDD